jgi:NADPH:quinone reductase-like Zn-dependent oxidoreductase
MKAVVFHEPGGPDKLKLEDLPSPEVGRGEILVEVAYCGVNPVDRSVITGAYPARPMPHISGCEITGTIAVLGEGVTDWSVGDRVAVAWRLIDETCPYCLVGEESLCLHGGILGVITQGGFAEFVKIPAINAVPLPDGVSLEQAAAVTLSGVTAWHMLLRRARVRPGESVLVVGASGGVGSAAVQLAKMAGAYVIAVASGADKIDELRSLGADEVIDRSKADFQAETLRLTGGLGADVVVDPVGAASWDKSFASVARNGRWTTVGTLTGGPVSLNLAALYGRQIQIVGSTGATRKELGDLLSAVARGAFKPIVYRTYPLDQVAEAFKELDSGERIGKILLKMAD